MTEIKQVVTFGEIMLRLAPPGFERFLQTPGFVATWGGGEANVAVSVAGFGLPASFVTVVPSNPIADAMIAELRRFNVGTSNIVRGKGRSEEHTSELQSRRDLVCRLLLEKKKRK